MIYSMKLIYISYVKKKKKFANDALENERLPVKKG